MKKNLAGQSIGAQMVTISDGSDFTGAVTVAVTKDNGTKTAGGGTVVHEGAGWHSYVPTQAETNADHIAFHFSAALAVSATPQVYTTFPQTGDSFLRLGAPAGASIAADLLVIDNFVDGIETAVITNAAGVDIAADIIAIKVDTGELQTDWVNGGRLDLLLDAIPTTAMRGTDGANTTAPDNAGIAAILIDTGTSLPATLSDMSGGTFNSATDSLEAIRDRGDTSWVTGAGGSSPTVQQIVDGVWDELSSAHVIAGSLGKFLDVEVSSVSGGGGLTQQNVRDAMKLAPSAGAPVAGSVDTHLDDIVLDTGNTLSTQIASLNDFDPALDTVVNVTNVAVNADMRGTNNAALASEVTAARMSELDAGTPGKMANQIDIVQQDTTTDIPALIAGLNDVAATDIVSAGAIVTLSGAVVNVNSVDITTTNSDMRGTDNSNTVVPDNAGVTANGVAIAALNDFNPATDTVAVVTDITNLPPITAGWLTSAGIAASALDGKGDWNIGKTGYAVTGMTFTVPGLVDVNIQRVNDTLVVGTGASGNEWGA